MTKRIFIFIPLLGSILLIGCSAASRTTEAVTPSSTPLLPTETISPTITQPTFTWSITPTPGASWPSEVPGVRTEFGIQVDKAAAILNRKVQLIYCNNIDPEGETRYIGDFGGAAGARYHFSAFAPYTYDPSTGKPVMCTLSAFSEESRTQSPQHLTLLMYINDREEREYFLILEKEDINGNSLPGVDTAWVVSDPGGDMSYFVQPGHYYFGRSWSITEKQYSALAEAGIQEWLSVYSTKIAPSSTTPVPLTTNFLP